jgi:hypothetical protein
MDSEAVQLGLPITRTAAPAEGMPAMSAAADRCSRATTAAGPDALAPGASVLMDGAGDPKEGTVSVNTNAGTVKLNRTAYEYAQELIRAGHRVIDDRDAWSEHQPSAEQENEFIAEHGWTAYGRWHLGVDREQNRETKGHYKFPYGDFRDVHRCGVLAAESRAGQRDYRDIELAAAHLHGMLDEGGERA